jgi:hypothetical protein
VGEDCTRGDRTAVAGAALPDPVSDPPSDVGRPEAGADDRLRSSLASPEGRARPTTSAPDAVAISAISGAAGLNVGRGGDGVWVESDAIWVGETWLRAELESAEETAAGAGGVATASWAWMADDKP